MARQQQRGLALVTAMLVVAIVATVATYLGFRQQLWLRQVQNTTDRATVESVRQGALAYAIVILEDDLRRNQTDTLHEKWNQPLVLPFEGGAVAIAVSDAQARFNLHNLLRSAPFSQDDAIFLRQLLSSLKLDPELVNATIDWVDKDENRSANGAEDIEYLTLATPYRTGSQPLQSVDELRLVKGFTKEAVDALRPFVIALPENTDINVNTAPEAVLAAMFAAGGDVAVKAIVRARESKGFDKLGDFDNAVTQTGVGLPKVPRGVATSFFVVEVDVRVGNIYSRTEALVQRKGNKQSSVLWQRPRPLQIIPDAPQAS